MIRKKEDLESSCEIMMEEERYFTCMCTRNISLTKFDNLSSHISKCKEYQSKSPIFIQFQQIPLGKLRNEQILAIISEFEIYNQRLKDELTHRKDPLLNQVYPPAKNGNHDIIDKSELDPNDIYGINTNKSNSQIWNPQNTD